MKHLIDVAKVFVLNVKKEQIAEASGKAIRLVVKDFIERGEAGIIVFMSPTGEKVFLSMSHGGDMQIFADNI